MTARIQEPLALVDSAAAFCNALRDETASAFKPRSIVDTAVFNQASAQFIADLRKNVLNQFQTLKENAELRSQLADMKNKFDALNANNFIQNMELMNAKDEIEALKREIERLKGPPTGI